MESNNMTQYKDLTPAPRLDNKTLNRMAWRSMQLQACFNYERMQSAGWLWAILPGLEKIHTNKDDLATSMTHNMDFLNTHPFIVTFVMGIVLSMEQQKMDIQTIRSVRISTAAPLGGIGDALFWMSLVPIVAGMTAQMAIDGSIIGPILYFIFIFGVEMALRYGLLYWSYNMGTKAITAMTKYAKEFTHAASVLGVFIVGALIANYGGGTKLGISVPNGETAAEVEKLVVDGKEVVTETVTEMQPVFINIQDYFDKVLPCLIPLLLTLLCFFLIKKKGWTPVKCIGLMLVIGIVGAVFGIWAGGYQPLVPVPWTVL
ncbi:PTS system mannose/fructose/sorbose family transporter subunit IID [Faecalitalea cylindroides]|uniref:PTS system mannose/fructose/sorbose family transporter subunit IID n=1 Tax=Faecalitalea cylindroides TaxID=39483 RepID=UPI000B391F77|nr:PTS system mannose/fructose/sorbose family transporter subunit IID [Faecalitalea cylindroides]MBM6652012.1 PTS system mannose/fructose/sorbose family transporter subunit IID [Faecalitalea cylindroides]OUN63642.1 PTS acetylgalactosamine transporter subunit IID [Faecalitalea cylindroides]